MSSATARQLARSLPAPVRETGRTLAHWMCQSTRAWRGLPTFLIVGAQRCGTTSLFKALIQHPQVHGPLLGKGVHFFDVAHHRGLDWYRGHFPLRRDNSDSVGTGAAAGARNIPPVHVGESSPYYLFHPLAAERIARDLPHVHVLVALRDPVERAYSAHTHEVARGFETASFATAIELEQQRLAGLDERLVANPQLRLHAHQHHAYLQRGQYIDQLERLSRHVPRERVHIVESERFFAAPEHSMAQVLDFLGLADHPTIGFARHNAQPRCTMDPELRVRLQHHFDPYDQRLANWLGRAPAWRE